VSNSTPRYNIARLGSIVTLLIVLIGNMALWWYLNRPFLGYDYTGMIEGVSFNPFRENQNPDKGINPSLEQIEKDLQILAGKVKKVRTYRVSYGFSEIPKLAKKYGIKVDVGVWINADPEQNQREIDQLFEIYKDWPSTLNISSILVGNEVLVRKELPIEDLIQQIRKVRQSTFIPVSTAETWDNWMAHPELADEVDFIAVHILPYWEGIPIENAVGHIQSRYELLKNKFKGKKIVLSEVGWPSEGRLQRSVFNETGERAGFLENFWKFSVPDETNQVKFLREFLNYAGKNNIDYFIIEAFDQPWKIESEGQAGAYWGIYDTERKPKFSLSGPFIENPQWPIFSGIAILLSLIPSLMVLRSNKKMHWRGMTFFAVLIQLLISFFVWVIYLYTRQYLSLEMAIVWTIMVFLQLGLIFVVISQSFEAAELLSNESLSRDFKPAAPDPHFTPKVSIHVPIYNEPVEMVKMTLTKLLELDYKNFEVLVIDNNTKDEAVWKPIQDFVATLDSRFKFFHLPHCPGFKAGALNFALKQTATDAEVVGVIDSDYLVKSDWLSGTTPYFKNPKVGFVQAPQDHYDANLNLFKNMCNWEYMGFFHIGMVHRNERNAIIQHGTMTLIRKTALDEVGGWAEWCICEDTELGLRLFKKGYESIYINHVFGQGVTPDSLAAYKGQRYRWAYGAMQILKGHFRDVFWTSKNLTVAQKYHFAVGWHPWIADALNLLLSFLAIFWSFCILFLDADFPVTVFLLPVLGLFIVKVFQNIFMYMYRVRCSFKESIKAAVAGLALTHTVSVATFWGIFTKKMPFKRTPKWQKQSLRIKDILTSRMELFLLSAMWILAGVISYKYGRYDPEALLWSLVLILMSVPYAATLFMACLPKNLAE